MKMWLVRRRAERARARWIAVAIAATTFTAPALASVITANPAEAAGGTSVAPGQPTLSNPVAGGNSDYTIPFTTSATGAVGIGGTITIVAPAGTVFPSCLTPCTNYQVNGTSATGASVSPNQVAVTVPSAISANTLVSLVIQSVENPTAASSTYTLQESTSTDTTPATSPAYSVTAGAPASIVATGGDNQSTVISTQFAQKLVATVVDAFGNSETPNSDTVLFNTAGPGPASASFSGGGATDSASAANGTYTSTTLTANGTAGSYTVSATLMNGANPVPGVTAGSFKLTNLSGPPPGSVTPGTVTLGTPTAGATSSYTVPFTTSTGGALGSNSTITFIAPPGTLFPSPSSLSCLTGCPGYSISGGSAGTNISAVTTSAVDGSTTANKVVMTLGGVSPSVGPSTQVTVTITSVGNPTASSSSYTIGELTSTDLTQVQSPSYAVGPAAAAKVAAVSGTPQGAMKGTHFASPLVAAVEDTFGNSIPNQFIVFNIGQTGNGASALFANNTATEQDRAGTNGLATTSLVTANGTTGGPYAVTASVPNNSSISVASFFLTNTAGQVIPGSVILGSPVAGAQAVTYTIPFTLTSAGTLPSSGGTITLTFPASTVLSAAQSDYLVNATPPSHGNTSVPVSSVSFNGAKNQVTINLGGGIAASSNVTVTAHNVTNPSVAGSSNSITEQTSVDNTPAQSPAYTITAGPASQIQLPSVSSGSGQSASPATQFANPLKALVTDQFGNPIVNVNVTFALPGSQPSATFGPCVPPSTPTSCVVATDSSGVATSAPLTAGSGTGPYLATATAAGVSGHVNFNLTNATVLTAQNITVTPATAGNNNATYQVPFITSSSGALPAANGSCSANCQVTLVAPNGTALPGVASDYSVTVNDNHAATIGSVAVSEVAGPGSTGTSTTSNSAVISLSSSSIAPGDLVTVTISGVTNPTTAAGGYSFQESTSADNGPVTSPHYALTASTPATLTVVSGSPQSQTVGQEYNSPLEVNIVDAFGNPVSGAAVTFTAPAQGASVSFESPCSGTHCVVSTDSSGSAITPKVTANSSPGTFQVSAAAGNLTGAFNLDNLVGPPSRITIVSGNPQSAVVNTQYSNPLVVRVTDSLQNPIGGVPVSFTAPSSGASVSFNTANCNPGSTSTSCLETTDSSGEATSSAVTANSSQGTVAVTVADANDSSVANASFSLTNLAQTPTQLNIVSGNNQSTRVGTAYGSTLQVQVLDASNTPVPNVAVTFTAPASGPSVTFAHCSGGNPTPSGCVVNTDSTGVATSSTMTANSASGQLQVTASGAGLPTQTFNLRNLAGPAGSMSVIAGSGQEMLVLNPFDSTLSVKLVDSLGNPVSGAPVTFAAPSSGATAFFDTCSGGNPSDMECVVDTDSSGVATSSTVFAGPDPGTFNVQAVATGVAAQVFTLTDVQSGYWTVASDGGIFAFGGAPFYGSTGAQHLNAPIVGMAESVGGGYYLVASDGGIFTFGPDATFYGSTGAQHLNAPIVGMAVDPQTGGYWLVARDGGVFSFNAPFWGSMGAQHLNAPIVGMAATPEGGYYLVASDGGIFTFGPGATFYGSTGAQHLNAPIVGMATAPDGGYWLVASDGGIFTFGPGAVFFGSAGDQRLNSPIVGMAVDPATGGYWLVASDGGIFSFGAPFYGSMGATRLNAPMVGISPSA